MFLRQLQLIGFVPRRKEKHYHNTVKGVTKVSYKQMLTGRKNKLKFYEYNCRRNVCSETLNKTTAVSDALIKID